ncbi:BMP family ABC transporter substrate-binding protein [Micromonospora sp. NBC_01655]|uniref:BMP family ABC transporter substrate-binding protein n=1 Tax=Micromonospora sp. NBC_01655 TaxID=2975983 RepID=UPI002259CFD6|nr:BMP family ABC transporter substrate-binding protein [Micromonospora sp. NBC_01655]MCX4474630.1 BMP family ABC transporter substrate-binding protein [Micromonospora sp. NBC_01655]
MRGSRVRAAIASAAVMSLLLTACDGSESSGGSGAPGERRQPDVNGDGKVVVGILSPGDTKDGGYYQSFVDDANKIARAAGWEVRTIDRVNPAVALTQARNLCRQRVDLIAVGAGELKDALTAAPEDYCQGVNWYVNSGSGIAQTEYFAQSKDVINQTLYAAGYAAGLLLQRSGGSKAGYITGPELDFAKQGARAFETGLRAVLPKAQLVVTYTGSFNDSAKAKEAFVAQRAQGVGIVYPYLGGATDAVAREANLAGVPVLTPGTDRCADSTVRYAVSVVFSPGTYFAAALDEFRDGTLKMGTTRLWTLGVDPVPTVRICAPEGDQQARLDQVMKDIGSGRLDVDAAVAKLR